MHRVAAPALERQALEQEQVALEDQLEERADRGGEGRFARLLQVDGDVQELVALLSELGGGNVVGASQLDPVLRIELGPDPLDLGLDGVHRLGGDRSRQDQVAVLHPALEVRMLLGGEASLGEPPVHPLARVQPVGPQPAEAAVVARPLPAQGELVEDPAEDHGASSVGAGRRVHAPRRHLHQTVLLGDPGGQGLAPHAARVEPPELRPLYEPHTGPVAPDERPRLVPRGQPVLEPGAEGRLGGRPVLRGPLAARRAVTGARCEVDLGGGLERIEAREALHGILPGRVQARVDEEHVVPGADQRTGGQPVEELVAVGRAQEVVERVALTQLPGSGAHSQEVHVVVAEDAARAERAHQPQHPQGVRSAVHEIADRLEPVDRGIEADLLQEPLQLLATALDVPDEDATLHGVESYALESDGVGGSPPGPGPEWDRMAQDGPSMGKRPRSWRLNGLVLVVLLVAGGMGITSAYYHWRAPGIVARMKAERAGLPDGGEPRLERWVEFGRTLIHKRLVQLRYSAGRPWLIAHVVEPVEGGGEVEPEIWGVDFTDLPPEVTGREGMVVVVSLPPAKLLGRGRIGGDKALHVPSYAEGAEIPDPAARAAWIVAWSLEKLIEALEGDIEGASLEVRIGEKRFPVDGSGEEEP